MARVAAVPVEGQDNRTFARRALGPTNGYREGDDFPESRYFQLRLAESATGDILSPKSRNLAHIKNVYL
jgi:hypothetical protein